jgi:hypothetical protein
VGVVQGSFVIPAGIQTGTREVVLSDGINAATVDGVSGSVKASTTFVCPGKVIDTQVVSHTIITTSQTIRRVVDPVAESFSFDNDQFITRIGLFFASKDPAKNVTVEIRNMDNGYPGDIQYGITVLTPAQINVSAKGTAETTVVFDDPIFCEANEQYCVIVATDSNITSLFVANLGDKDLNTGAYITKQAYNTGVLFTSSNALTWTAQQSRDLKFRVYGARFKNIGCVVFDPLTINANRINLSAITELPNKTSCQWEYKLNNETVWNALPPYVDIFLPAVATKIQLRAKITGTPAASPILSLEGAVLNTYLSKTSGTYVTRNVVMSQPYTTVKQVVDMCLPSGAVANVRYCYDTDGVTEANWKQGSQSSVTQINSEYSQYVFQATIPAGVNPTNFRARIDFSTTSPTIQPKVKNLMNILK